MSLRLRIVRTSDGSLLQEALVRGVFAVSREDELADFHHASVGHLEVAASGSGYGVNAAGQRVSVDTYLMLDFGDVALHCTVLRARRDGRATPGACPRCYAPLRPAQMGAAYRSVATDRLECPRCHVQVLSLRSATESLGAASTAGSSWVRVVSAMSCPQCARAMSPATLTVGQTGVGVDACHPCERVLLEPEDIRALEVAAQGLGT